MNHIFRRIKVVQAYLPDEETIKREMDLLTRRYMDLKTDPHIFANGSVPRAAMRSPDLTAERKLKVEIYQAVREAPIEFALLFQENVSAIHLGGLGLILLRNVLPFELSCIAFEAEDVARVTSLLRVVDGEYEFMIRKKGVPLDCSDGFVCISDCEEDW